MLIVPLIAFHEVSSSSPTSDCCPFLQIRFVISDRKAKNSLHLIYIHFQINQDLNAKHETIFVEFEWIESEAVI